MDKNYHVYKIINSINNKIYIGKTCGNINVRWNQHKSIARNKNTSKKCAIHYAIAKYGVENFQIIILKSFENENDAYAEEVSCIFTFDTIKNGYNRSSGGRFGSVWTNEQSNSLFKTQKEIENVFKKYIELKSFSKTAIYFNCTKTTIIQIIYRLTYKGCYIKPMLIDEINKIKILKKKTDPKLLNKNDIINDYINNNFSYRMLCEKYNTSTVTIRKFLKNNQDALNKIKENTYSPHSIEFIKKIFNDYIYKKMLTNEIALKYNITKHVINDILCFRTADKNILNISELILLQNIKNKNRGQKIDCETKKNILEDIKILPASFVANKYNVSESLIYLFKREMSKKNIK